MILTWKKRDKYKKYNTKTIVLYVYYKIPRQLYHIYGKVPYKWALPIKIPSTTIVHMSAKQHSEYEYKLKDPPHLNVAKRPMVV